MCHQLLLGALVFLFNNDIRRLNLLYRCIVEILTNMKKKTLLIEAQFCYKPVAGEETTRRLITEQSHSTGISILIKYHMQGGIKIQFSSVHTHTHIRIYIREQYITPSCESISTYI